MARPKFRYKPGDRVRLVRASASRTGWYSIERHKGEIVTIRSAFISVDGSYRYSTDNGYNVIEDMVDPLWPITKGDVLYTVAFTDLMHDVPLAKETMTHKKRAALLLDRAFDKKVRGIKFGKFVSDNFMCGYVGKRQFTIIRTGVAK